MTQETKHTPGPWCASYSQRGNYWFIEYEQGGELYTLITGLNEANARLIAAAAELLETLIAGLSAMPQCEMSILQADAMYGWAKKARAAIAKATAA